MKNKHLLLILVLIAVISLYFGSRNGVLEGADSLIPDKIAQIREDYNPWFDSLWKPPSGEIESMLFTIQAVLGAGVIGYFFGKKRCTD